MSLLLLLLLLSQYPHTPAGSHMAQVFDDKFLSECFDEFGDDILNAMIQPDSRTDQTM